MWCTSVTRGVRSHSGVRNVIPLTTSSTTSASRASPRAAAHAARGKTVSARAHVVQLEARRRLARPRCGAVVGARDDRHAMAPLEPARDLAEQVRAGPAALRVRPVAVGQKQDVAHRRQTVADGGGLHWPAHAARTATPARARRRRGPRRPRRRLRPGRRRRPVLRPVRLRAGAGDADADARAAPAATATPAPAQPAARPRPRQPGPAPRRPRPRGPSLPYTGVDDWLAAAGGALLLGAGLTLRARLRDRLS